MLEIITCAATHGFLPLMENFPEAVRAQIFIARDHYREMFGRDPRGIWLPECAYVPRRSTQVLQEANLRWFILDSHGLMFGNPRPRYAIYAPVFTPAGPAAFGRDRESSRQVWSAEEGYPGDPAYRDFYRDIGFDLSLEYLRAFLPADGTRKFTGLKYHRITGRTHGQGTLQPRVGAGRGGCITPGTSWARAPAQMPASAGQHERAADRGQPVRRGALRPLVVRGTGVSEPLHPQIGLRPGRVQLHHAHRIILKENDTHQLLVPSASSWGHKGYWEVWLDDSNSWIYPHLHMAARRMTELARRFLLRVPEGGEPAAPMPCSSAPCGSWRASFSSRSRATGPS